MKKSTFNHRGMILLIVSAFLSAFFAMLALSVADRCTFNGFGDPPSVLTDRESLVISMIFEVPFSIMVAIYIFNVSSLYRKKAKLRRYLQLTLAVVLAFLLAVVFVWVLVTKFPNIWKGAMSIVLYFTSERNGI